MDRLNEIKAPTLILAGREDFQFPPEHQQELAAGIPNSRLVIIDRAGHNVQDEQPGEVLRVIRGTFWQSPLPAAHDNVLNASIEWRKSSDEF